MTFEEAVRKLFGVDDSWHVGADMDGGESVQIGDYSWDTEPRYISVYVHKDGADIQERKFDTLPDLWKALE